MLTGKKTSSKEYGHVWNKFEMKTVKDYHDFYLKCDVLLSADVFEKFRNNNIKNYTLLPSHYLSAPAISWDAILDMTKVILELISNPNMYIFFEKGMKGGVSSISSRYSKVDNKCFKSYDPKKESKHVMYLDANNLCGYAMSKFFPPSGFKWIDLKELPLAGYLTGYH